MVVRAFTTTPNDVDLVLTTAAGLAVQHRLRAEAHQLACDPYADDQAVAAATRAVNAVDAACAVLIDQVDVWAATALTESRTGFVHTETLGQLVDRVACVWMRWHLLDGADRSARQARARVAFHQLGELAGAYDDLLTDLQTGRRRLPRYQTPTGPTAA